MLMMLVTLLSSADGNAGGEATTALAQTNRTLGGPLGAFGWSASNLTVAQRLKEHAALRAQERLARTDSTLLHASAANLAVAQRLEERHAALALYRAHGLVTPGVDPGQQHPQRRMLAVPSPEQRAIRPAGDAILNTDSWCPTRGGQSIGELLDGAGLKWASPYNRSTPARCDLSAKQWLFVVSPGGRTGSTTVLDMINAHPAFGLAGENRGQLLTAMELFNSAAEQPANREGGGAWGRGAVDPYNLLCDLAGWFEDVTPPGALKGDLTMESLQAHAEAAEEARAAEEISRSAAPSGSSVSEQGHTVQGFKEIRWGLHPGVENMVTPTRTKTQSLTPNP